MKALKFLKSGAIGPYSGFQWPVPKGDKPGKWVMATGDLVECQNGIHACTLDGALEWLQYECYVIELSGKTIVGDGKIVARKGRLLYKTRLNNSSLRLFAADCAEHVLHLFEAVRPDDDRPRKAIETARAFANGRAIESDMAAARAAAYAVAWDVAWEAVANAARAAARAAARDAARAAARAAARDVAFDIAWDVAWEAVANAARAAAGDAARAAWAAEPRWQIRRLKRYLKLPKGWDA